MDTNISATYAYDSTYNWISSLVFSMQTIQQLFDFHQCFQFFFCRRIIFFLSVFVYVDTGFKVSDNTLNFSFEPEYVAKITAAFGKQPLCCKENKIIVKRKLNKCRTIEIIIYIFNMCFHEWPMAVCSEQLKSISLLFQRFFNVLFNVCFYDNYNN